MRGRAWLGLSLLAALVTWTYAIRIQLPWEHTVNVEHGQIKVEMGDLYSRWVGTRALLLRGLNPYGPEVTAEIQTGFYGHAIPPQEGGSKRMDEQRFAYPVYVVFFLAPTVHMDFARVQSSAWFILAALTALGLLFWLDTLHWRPPGTIIGSLILFVLASPQIIQGLRLRQLGLLVGFLIALSVWCLVRNQLVIAGILLAFSTIKPQMVVLVLMWLILWGGSQWRSRWRFLAAFGATLLALVGLGCYLLPGWPRYFIEGIAAYRKYEAPASLIVMSLGAPVGLAASALLFIGLCILVSRSLKSDSASPAFLQSLALCLVATTLLLPLLPPFNQVFLILPLLMILQHWSALARPWKIMLTIFLAWPWATSLALLAIPSGSYWQTRIPLLPSAFAVFTPAIFAVLLVTQRKVMSMQFISSTD